VAVADVDGAGCAGSLSTPACMKVGVEEESPCCFAGWCGFETPSVSVSAAEVVSMEEAAAAV